MSAPGIPKQHNGTAPDAAVADAAVVEFRRTVQGLTVKNVEALGGAVLEVSFDNGNNYIPLDPKEWFSIGNTRLNTCKVRGQAGATADYIIVVVEQ